MEGFGLYIHIPFCESKCYYCDFNSYSNKMDFTEKYIEYLLKEIDMYSHKLKEYKLETIFIGGGTPSAIHHKYIYRVLDYVYKKFNVDNLLEVSIEGNPNSLDYEKLKNYKSIGINRLSMGLQTLEDNLLKKIGRVHSTDDFYNSYNIARKVGFNNINIDVMFNLPGQSVENVINTLENLMKLDPEHISYYSLKLEEGTLFHKKYYDNLNELPSEDDERKMYYEGIKILGNSGYKHYEISNFAKNGFECKHNLVYWKLKPYLGIGLGSHSNLFNRRWGNKILFDDYYNDIDNNKTPIDEVEIIDNTMEMAEFVMLGLRLVDGVDKKEFKLRFTKNIKNVYGDLINKFSKDGLLLVDEERIALTEKGRDLSNLIFMELLP